MGLITAGHEPAAHSINSPLSPSATACGMLCAPSLMRNLRRWLLTESTEWPSQTAVSRLVSPSAARARTWSSAGVRSSLPAGVARTGEVRVGVAAEAPLELVTGDRAVMPVRPFVAPVLIPHLKRPRALVDVERLRDPVESPTLWGAKTRPERMHRGAALSRTSPTRRSQGRLRAVRLELWRARRRDERAW
jgi:hypothetical protein